MEQTLQTMKTLIKQLVYVELVTQTQQKNNPFLRLMEHIRQREAPFHSDTQYKKIPLEMSISWPTMGTLFILCPVHFVPRK